MIQLRNLSKSFKTRNILENISLSVPAHSALGIIGPSGAGKSLLLKMIAEIVPPTEGTVHVDSARVSMLFQKNALFDSLSLLENLTLPLCETMGVELEAARVRAMELLTAVGLEQSAHQMPDEISGGMQKRLGIARALSVDPEVILYDEPTAGLDPITGRSIADLILRLHRANRTTLVMVTNDLQRAYQVCDSLAFCSEKSLRLLGTPDEVKSTSDPEIQHFIYSNALNLRSKGTH